MEHCFEKKYGTCILPKNGTSSLPKNRLNGTSSLPKNRLAEDKDSVNHHIMGNVQDYSQLIEDCGIVHFYVIVSMCNPFII